MYLPARTPMIDLPSAVMASFAPTARRWMGPRRITAPSGRGSPCRSTPLSHGGRRFGDKQRTGESRRQRQATFLQAQPQPSPAALQPAFHRAGRAAEALRRFFQRLAFQAAEDQGRSILFWERLQFLIEGVDQ